MRLVCIYSNVPEIFPPIEFKDGVNIIFGRISSKEKLRDAHNLGKTFLISVIDFCLLADLDRSHPFKSKSERFDHFNFILEIRSNGGKIISVGRNVKDSNKIYIHVGQRGRSADLSQNWNYAAISAAKAKKILNELLDLSDIEPFAYRKGLTYCLRKQSDYNDVFRTSKFIRSADIFWKPYVAKVIGLDFASINTKYELDSRIEKARDEIRALENAMGRSVSEFDEMRGVIDIRRSEISILQQQLSNWNFRDIDKESVEKLVNEVDQKLKKANEQAYKLRTEYEMAQVSLSEQFHFDIDEVSQIFKEMSINFPEQLKRSYEQLIEFNKSISTARNSRLQELSVKLSRDIENLSRQIELLNSERSVLMSDLLDAKSFDKMKTVHSQIIEKEREVASLESKLSVLDETTIKEIEIRNMNRSRDEAIAQVFENVRGKNKPYATFRHLFSDISERILGTKGLLSTRIYDNGSIDFETKILDSKDSSHETSEAQGTSYRKMLCVTFDLSLLAFHSKGSFYRFTYHDGVFEGLDNIRKVNLLETINGLVKAYNIQYILTVIDTDRPRNESDQKLLFSNDEVILELHDDGDDGRLFKMPKF